MKQINYLKILKDSWRVTWNNKYLWWFGFFLAFGVGGGPAWPKNNSQKTESDPEAEALAAKLNDFISNHWHWLVAGALFMFFVILVIIVLKTICQGGIIKSGMKIIKGQSSSFKQGFSAGRQYFWKILWISLLVQLFMLGIVFVLASPVVFLILIESYVWAIILGIAAFAIIIVISIIAFFVRMYGIYYATLSDLGIKSSLENSFQLFKNNFIPSLIFALIYTAASIIFVVGLLFILIGTSIILLIFGYLMEAIFAKIVVIGTIVVGGAIIIIVLSLLAAVFETFKQIGWLLFFCEIASEKKEEKIAKELTEVSKKALEAGEA